ncbi:MAG: cytochrome c biogenesis protein ResB [Anaerolineae bacterium]|nr:cytochrome c biogenesis protein ResB [Anaerolineae bacterium]
MRIDILDQLWRLFGSRRLTLGLLSVILLVLATGAMLPQMPNDLMSGSPDNTLWRADIRARYAQWADPLESLGLLSIRSSLWLRLPLALLAVNLVVCCAESLEAALRWPRLSTEDPAQSIPSASLSCSIFLTGLRNTVTPTLQQALRGLGYAAEIRENEASSFLIGRRHSRARWSLPLAHGGALLIIVGLLVGERLAWTEQGIALSAGQQYELQHSPFLAIRLDELKRDPDSAGTALANEALITILDSDEEMSSGVVSAAAPLWYKGIAVSWMSPEPLIRLQARDAGGDPLLLQGLAPSGEPTEEVVVQFSNEENEGYVAVPERNLVLRLVLQSTSDAGSGQPPRFLWEAYRGGSTEVVSRVMAQGTASQDIDGDSYLAEWGQYAVLGISSDPMAAPLALGLATLLAGSTLFLFWRPRFVWATVRGTGNVVQVQVFSPSRKDSGVEPREFERLAIQIEEAVGAP